MISLKPEQLIAIRQHGEAEYPNECCGLLIGVFDAQGGKLVEEVFPLSNAREVTARHDRFLIAPLELLHGQKRAREKNCAVVGFYHSHPDHVPEPSQFDLENAWPVYSYVIVSVNKARAGEAMSWELRADGSKFDAEGIQEV